LSCQLRAVLSEGSSDHDYQVRHKHHTAKRSKAIDPTVVTLYEVGISAGSRADQSDQTLHNQGARISISIMAIANAQGPDASISALTRADDKRD